MIRISRECGACRKPIGQDQHLEIWVQVYTTRGPETQDPIEEQWDDYCDACIESGAAIRDLVGAMGAMGKYRLGHNADPTATELPVDVSASGEPS